LAKWVAVWVLSVHESPSQGHSLVSSITHFLNESWALRDLIRHERNGKQWCLLQYKIKRLKP
jgi:hypothetical protein